MGIYIKTKEIGPDGLGVDRWIESLLPLPIEGGEVVKVDRTHLTGDLLRDSGDLAFTGEIETVVTLPCGRCLEAYVLPLDLRFSLIYTTAPEGPMRRESRVDEESITLTHYDGVQVDLDALLREQIYLGLPLKPLCRPDCLGLCPRCGTNFNHGTCACPKERDDDPRFLALKKLL